jgi:hypothetical protein
MRACLTKFHPCSIKVGIISKVGSVMSEIPRKKSPRAPSFAIDDAIDRALRIYDKERRHPAPVDVIAKHLGYKSATNGAAMTAFATLRYYGLVERPREGMLAVSKELESYKFAPEERMRQEFVLKWLKTPSLFAELIEQYKGGLPSDATIKFDLIQRGFNDKSADAALTVFRRSLDYANYYEQQDVYNPHVEESADNVDEAAEVSDAHESDSVGNRVLTSHNKNWLSALNQPAQSAGVDRIPIRLGGGRRAWIEVPTPFYPADKERLKAQIDLLLTDDEEEKPDV